MFMFNSFPVIVINVLILPNANVVIYLFPTKNGNHLHIQFRITGNKPRINQYWASSVTPIVVMRG